MNARSSADTRSDADRAPPADVPRPAGPALRDAQRRRLAQALHASSGVGALVAGLRRGFHRQLLLAWIVVLMLPAAIAAVPVATWVQLQFGRSPQARAIAEGREPMLVADAVQSLGGEVALLLGSGGFAGLLAVALSPWLTGMIVAQIRTVYRLRMGGVLRAGLGEYPRMLRMLLWSLVPMGGAAALGAGMLWWVMRATGSRPDPALSPALLATAVLSGLLLLLVHVTLEAARGWLGADLALRSVFEAWKRGVALLLRQPAATLVVYLGTSAVGYGLALLFAGLRMHVHGSDWFGTVLAFALTQLVVAALAWGRSARLHGLADLATAIVTAREASLEDAARDLREATQRQAAEPAS